MFPALSILAPFAKTHVLKIVGIIGVMLIIGFAYYQYKANIRLRIENYDLRGTVIEVQARLETVKKQSEQITVINGQLVQKERELNQALFDLAQKFNKNGRSFEELARRKPGLIAPIINRASDDINRCIELTTMGEPCEY